MFVSLAIVYEMSDAYIKCYKKTMKNPVQKMMRNNPVRIRQLAYNRVAGDNNVYSEHLLNCPVRLLLNTCSKLKIFPG
jgi:hypothetical protein